MSRFDEDDEWGDQRGAPPPARRSTDIAKMGIADFREVGSADFWTSRGFSIEYDGYVFLPQDTLGENGGRNIAVITTLFDKRKRIHQAVARIEIGDAITLISSGADPQPGSIDETYPPAWDLRMLPESGLTWCRRRDERSMYLEPTRETLLRVEERMREAKASATSDAAPHDESFGVGSDLSRHAESRKEKDDAALRERLARLRAQGGRKQAALEAFLSAVDGMPEGAALDAFLVAIEKAEAVEAVEAGKARMTPAERQGFEFGDLEDEFPGTPALYAQGEDLARRIAAGLRPDEKGKDRRG